MILKDKVIIITGGESGIGLATALILADAGAKLVVSGHTLAHAEEAAEKVRAAGGTAVPVKADMSVESDIVAMVDRAISEFGRLDGAFNNAGVPMHNKLTDEIEASEYDQVNAVNARGVFLCLKYEIKAMRLTGGGAIVNNSSIESDIAVPKWTEYVTSKHAVNGLTRGASTEAKETGVRVNAVLPGYIVTPMTEKLLKDPASKQMVDAALERHSVGRFGQPEDVGYAVKWLLSAEAAFINGALLPVDGGFLAR